MIDKENIYLYLLQTHQKIKIMHKKIILDKLIKAKDN